MDKEGFRQYLKAREISEEEIEQQLEIAERFEGFLKEKHPQGLGKPATAEDVGAFSAFLIIENLNTYKNFLALARYARFIRNDEAYVAVVELIDGSEALESLHEKLGESVGGKRRDEVFRDIDLPPLGTPSSEKPKITQRVMERIESMVDPKTYQQILSNGLRHLEDEWFLEDKKKFLECRSLDEYLARKGEEFIAQLEQIKDEGGLFFAQAITDEVIDFVCTHPEIRSGVREGNILYEIKIPYMTKEYLAETDESMKRYYCCHCPWVRESIKAGDVHISPTFCLCSAGFVKKPWEVIFGQHLEAEIIESVLKGDRWCKIAIHLPVGISWNTIWV